MAVGIGPRSVYLEIGRQKVFACSLEWPGWARAAKTEPMALELFADYAGRYAVVAAAAGIPFDAGRLRRYEIVERLPGSAATDFGVPDVKPAADTRSLTAAAAERMAQLVNSSWTMFDQVVATAPPALRKGPRGGGRDRDRIVEHVLAAETSYVRKIGLRLKQPEVGDPRAINLFRREVLNYLRTARGSAPALERGWPPRYAVRRIAWHVLDHAWEIEDRRT